MSVRHEIKQDSKMIVLVSYEGKGHIIQGHQRARTYFSSFFCQHYLINTLMCSNL